MKIDLQEPFKSLWRLGYTQIQNSNRKYVCLFNSDKDNTIISYARYLMCCHLGYILSSEYEVDHINDDKTDDRIENLQVLTKEQNRLKQQWYYIEHVQNTFGYHCAYCNTPFLLTEREVKMRIYKNVELAFCSRSCAAKYHHLNKI